MIEPTAQGAALPEVPPLLVSDQTLKQTAREYKCDLLARMFGYKGFAAFAAEAHSGKIPGAGNLLGFGFGVKMTSGSAISGQFAVRVYVRSKKTARELSISEAVPANISGLPTDVLAIGDISAFHRPTACGVSVGHYLGSGGTLGCLVEQQVAPGFPCILSNNHVLANSNLATLGDSILEPAKLDGGDAFPPIAHLSAWLPLQFGGTLNHIDAAIARLVAPGDVIPDILNIGRVVHSPMPAALYQSVRKNGRTTRHTIGVVLDLSADIPALYGTHRAYFEDQIAIHGVGGPFALPGDSGSLIVDSITLRPIALLFAGGNGVTFANPIEPVLSALRIQII